MSRKTRKLIWSAPLVAVFAVIGALAIFAAMAPNSAQAHGLPGAVSDLTAKADGTKAVDLSWKAPATGGTPTGYRIDTSGDGQTWSSIMADTGSTATTYRDEMVSGVLGDDRFYRVFALNSAGAGPVSRTAGPVNVPGAGAPGNVTGITATAMGREAIKLTWTEPSSTGGTDAITKYLIAGATGDTAEASETTLDELTVNALPTTDDEDPANSSVLFATRDATTSYTLEGLAAGQTWYFRVYAYNGAKVSAGSSETRSATTDSLGKIGPATKVTAVEDPESGVVTLYWYWPADDGGRTISHWKIERKQTALSKLDQDTDTDGIQPQVNNEDGVQLNRWQAITVDDSHHATATTDAFDYTIAADATMTVGTETTDVLVPGAKYQYRVTARTGTAATDPADDTAPVEGTESAASNALTVKGPLVVSETDVGTNCGNLTMPAADATAAVKAEYTRVKGICDTSQARIVDDELSAKRDGKGNVEVTLTRGSPLKATSFRIDVALVEADRNKWMEVRNYVGNLGSDGEFVFEYEDPTTGGNLEYRVFAYVGSAQLLPSNPAPELAGLNEVEMPGKVENLKATPISQTQINVTWSAPKKDGDAVVDMYCVQVRTNASGDGFDALAQDDDHDTDNASPFDTAKGLCMRNASPGDNAGAEDMFMLTDKMSYSHKKLMAGETYYYKVYAINNPVYRGDNRSASSDTVSATTKKQDKPTMPTDLVAEAAKDSNYGGRANAGVYLLWNAPPKPAGGMIDSYVVQRKVGDGSWSNVHSDSDTGNMRTIFHDTTEPADGEMRAYRVAAKNASGTSDEWSNVAYYPAMTHVPGKPTLTAMKDADMPGTKVKLTWTEPAMNADNVTGYIIERRHAGDMMGDIPSDGYNAEVMGASHAFMDYKEWWETLNCKGMLAVAGSSASVTATEGESAQDRADRGMYCKHFANTAPTNMAFTGKTVSEATAMKIKEMFMKRYVTDDMGKTMTMFTGMMYTDMGLMESTKYTYRVRAIHGMKAGMWSDKVMVTTGTDNNDPMKVGTIAAVTVEVGETSDPMDVSRNFSDTDGDTLTYRAISSDDDTATAAIPAGSSMLTVTGVAEGSATITVTASDGKGGTDAMQTIAVTVTPAAQPELTAPTGVSAVVDDTDPGVPDIVVTWTDGENADRHMVALFDTTDPSNLRLLHIEAAAGGTHTFNNVASSGKYTPVVLSISNDDTGGVDSYRMAIGNEVEVQ